MIEELGKFKPDLVLSGHTHGGQIFPFGLLVLLDQPYLYAELLLETAKSEYEIK